MHAYVSGRHHEEPYASCVGVPIIPEGESSSDEIDAQFQALTAVGDWRGAALTHLRALIKQADPDIVEEVKWRKLSNPAGVPTYSHNGLVGTLEHYRDKVKFTFAKGSRLEDPAGVFNSGFGGARRVIDLFEGDAIDDEAFKDLIRAAVGLNGDP